MVVPNITCNVKEMSHQYLQEVKRFGMICRYSLISQIISKLLSTLELFSYWGLSSCLHNIFSINTPVIASHTYSHCLQFHIEY